jgi:effector-binding domain-containing protein
MLRKWLIGLTVFILLVLSGLYIFIPGNLNISVMTTINCTVSGATRCVSDQSKWGKWWPGTPSAKQDSFFIYKSGMYQIHKKLLNGIVILIIDRDSKVSSTINAFQSNTDSSIIEWRCTLASGLNPIRRLLQYRHAVMLKKNMDTIFQNLCSFLEKKENIYGISISKSSVTDSLLVATKSIVPFYPSTKEVYDLIKFLQIYISKQGAGQTGSPMMNVTKLATGQFQLMVAVPTNKKLSSSQNISSIKLVNGNYLVAIVSGGLKTVDEALTQMQFYFQDYQKTAMAIPFESLVTDRIKEPDSTKWLTKIYAPVLK